MFNGRGFKNILLKNIQDIHLWDISQKQNRAQLISS